MWCFNVLAISKSSCELVIFVYVQDLEGLEVIGKGQPFTSVSAEAFRHTTHSEEIENQ